MKRLKVVTVVGTRPELIRLSCLIPKLDKYTDHTLIHTGQNSDPNLKDVFFRDLEIRQPDVYLDAASETPGATMGKIMSKIETILIDLNPDAVMILGDTNSAVAAIIAERLYIPVYHMEAGNRSFDQNVPEELNRRMVDHVSTFNLPYNAYSQQNLLDEGIHPRFIFKTGSPMAEVFSRFGENIDKSAILEDLQLDAGQYIVASLHRQENVDNPTRLADLIASLEAVSVQLSVPVVVSTHPRTLRRLDTIEASGTGNLRFLEPFGFFDYCKLQKHARIVISDSGTVSEESSLLEFPAITVRDSMERPEALAAGGIILAGVTPGSVLPAVEFALDSRSDRDLPEGYASKNFSELVLTFLLSTAHLARTWKGLN